MLTPHRYTSLKTQLGECPVWDEENQILYVMDCRIGLIHQIDADSTIRSFAIPSPAGSLSLNHNQQLVVALKEHISLLNLSDGSLKILARIEESNPHIRLNDGIALNDGSFIVGTMHTQRTPNTPALGGVYRLYPSGIIKKVATGIGIANGPCINPINQRFYLCDSSEKRIDSYLIDTDGSLTDAKFFANTESLNSAPDGCAFDEDGGLWTALVHQSAIVRFDLEGQITHRISIPAQHPSALCFGGPLRQHIYVTSICQSDRLSASGPLDGALFCIPNSGFTGVAIAKTQFNRLSPQIDKQ